MSVHLSVHASVHASVDPSVHESVHLSVHVSGDPSVHVSVHASVCIYEESMFRWAEMMKPQGDAGKKSQLQFLVEKKPEAAVVSQNAIDLSSQQPCHHFYYV